MVCAGPALKHRQHMACTKASDDLFPYANILTCSTSSWHSFKVKLQSNTIWSCVAMRYTLTRKGVLHQQLILTAAPSQSALKIQCLCAPMCRTWWTSQTNIDVIICDSTLPFHVPLHPFTSICRTVECLQGETTKDWSQSRLYTVKPFSPDAFDVPLSIG